ncbi:MAG: AbrB/MazE/SpoVT family DNA-binding domain-containing protein [Methyloceanibacter sp.]
MKVKIAKWGNSLAVRLPKRLADELGLAPGKTVELEKQGSKLAIETAASPKIPYYRLEDLLAQIKPGTEVPPLVDWGPDVGAEILPDEDWSDIAPTDGSNDENEASKMGQ